jgi:hypothetical protein
VQHQVQQIQAVPSSKQLAALEAAFKSIRRTRLYGFDNNIAFEWPNVNDLWLMNKNMPKKIAEFRHKTSTTDKHCFGAFQIVLSNGMASPVYKGED